MSTQDIVSAGVPQFRYQLQLASGEIEAGVQTPDEIRGFLNGMYAGRTQSKHPFLRPETGINLSLLKDVGPSPLLTKSVSVCSLWLAHGIDRG